MKILIVSTFFPPQNSIASLRPYSWAKWWSRAGHDVTVLTTEKEEWANNLNLDCSGFTVIKTPLWIPFGKANKGVKTVMNFNGESTISSQKFGKLKVLLFLRNVYTNFVTKTG